MLGSENDECQITIHQVHSSPSIAFNSYSLLERKSQYSKKELKDQESVSIELESSVTWTNLLFDEDGPDENTRVTIPRNMFGAILPAAYYRLFCLKNSHGTSQGCVFIAKAWLLYKWNIKPLLYDTLKTTHFSKTERNRETSDETYDTNMRDQIRACLSFGYEDDVELDRFASVVGEQLRTKGHDEYFMKGLGKDQFKCEESNNICEKIRTVMMRIKETNFDKTVQAANSNMQKRLDAIRKGKGK